MKFMTLNEKQDLSEVAQGIDRRSFLVRGFQAMLASSVERGGLPFTGVAATVAKTGGLLENGVASTVSPSLAALSSEALRTRPLLPPNASADGVVVGAGFAGISTARHLTRAGKKVLLMEARDRIGGRTYTETLSNGARLDVGGQWIGPTQRRVNLPAKELGVETFPTFNSGLSVLDDVGKLSRYSGTIPRISPLALIDMGGAMARLDKMAKTVNMEAPWNTPNAMWLDAQTMASWIDDHVWNRAAHRLLSGGLAMLFAADPGRISLLHALYFIKAAGNLNALLAVSGGAQQDRFTRGTLELASQMTSSFESSLYFNAPAEAIAQDSSGVTVHTQQGTVRALRAVVAIPPALASRIDYSPLLTADRDQLTQNVPMGSVIKCIAFYETPFWRAQGLNGQAVSTDGPIFATFDNGLPGMDAGVTLGFAIGPKVDELRRLSPEVRQKKVIEAFVRLFGPEAALPTSYVDHVWADEQWTRGCFLGFLPPGIWTTTGHALRHPEGRIHWAGTETAMEWNGYIEGALESGERAALEVLAALEVETTG